MLHRAACGFSDAGLSWARGSRPTRPMTRNAIVWRACATSTYSVTRLGPQPQGGREERAGRQVAQAAAAWAAARLRAAVRNPSLQSEPSSLASGSRRHSHGICRPSHVEYTQYRCARECGRMGNAACGRPASCPTTHRPPRAPPPQIHPFSPGRGRGAGKGTEMPGRARRTSPLLRSRPCRSGVPVRRRPGRSARRPRASRGCRGKPTVVPAMPPSRPVHSARPATNRAGSGSARLEDVGPAAAGARPSGGDPTVLAVAGAVLVLPALVIPSPFLPFRGENSLFQAIILCKMRSMHGARCAPASCESGRRASLRLRGTHATARVSGHRGGAATPQGRSLRALRRRLDAGRCELTSVPVS